MHSVVVLNKLIPFNLDIKIGDGWRHYVGKQMHFLRSMMFLRGNLLKVAQRLGSKYTNIISECSASLITCFINIARIN